ncbi:MAG TPA: hypothetical protein VGH69_12980 [Mycobacterium sp.]
MGFVVAAIPQGLHGSTYTVLLKEFTEVVQPYEFVDPTEAASRDLL